MSDKPEIRVFDSVSAAVANSQPPGLPPYADLPESAGDEQQDPAPEGIQETLPPETTVQPEDRKAPAKKTAAKSTTARAGSAGVKARANDSK